MGKTALPDIGKPRKFTKSVDPDRAIVKKHKRPKATANESTKTPSAPATADASAPAHPLRLRDVRMPSSAVGLTALQLTADQKTVVKRGCQALFGYKHVPENDSQSSSGPSRIYHLQAATSQLEQMMALAKQRKAAAAASKSKQ